MKGLGSWILLAGLLAFTCLPSHARADGMVIPKTAYGIPLIPDQRALIHYAAGVETLVIDVVLWSQRELCLDRAPPGRSNATHSSSPVPLSLEFLPLDAGGSLPENGLAGACVLPDAHGMKRN